MLQIRHGVFETNSSSTHSITMCMKDDYDRWEHGEVYLNDGWWSKDNESEYKGKQFVTRDEANDILNHDKYYHGNRNGDEDVKPEDLSNVDLRDYDLYTFEGYIECTDLEWFHDEYEIPSGEIVVSFGRYGYDY